MLDNRTRKFIIYLLFNNKFNKNLIIISYQLFLTCVPFVSGVLPFSYFFYSYSVRIINKYSVRQQNKGFWKAFDIPLPSIDGVRSYMDLLHLWCLLESPGLLG